MTSKLKIMLVAGARPNFMKIAPLMDAFQREDWIETVLVHTGQHYDPEMSDLFFKQLGIPEPDINLDVGSASHARQTAAIMTAFEPVLLDHRPDAVLVVGDVNSTIACGLTAVKLGIKLIHVEAGLRSMDRSMPEEINRILTDAISDLLFCSEQSGVDHLLSEGIDESRIFLVGNVMIDTLLRFKTAAEKSDIIERLRLIQKKYAVVTLHRPSNVDDPGIFQGIWAALEYISSRMPVVFPAHPRTRQLMSKHGYRTASDRLIVLEPMGYLDFLRLMSRAGIVLTDSGGIQEETTILDIPCLTLRHNTERPVTVELGTNRIVGTDAARIQEAFEDAVSHPGTTRRCPPHWDGQASSRIAKVIRQVMLLHP